MKAKRLTALALAALMAAGTTTVAFAGEKVTNDLDFANDGYYKYNSDTNRLESVAKDDFQPGDDVYLRLVEDPSDSFSNKKTYNAYADWTIGDSWVKDIDVVYRKGDISSVTGYDVTYSFKGDSISTTFASNDKAAFIKAQQDAVTADNKYVKDYISENFTNVKGYIYKDKIYPTFNDAAKAAGINVTEQTTWSYEDQSSTTSVDDLMSKLSASKVATTGYKYNGKYFADAKTLLTDSTNGLKISGAEVKNGENASGIYITESDVNTTGYGEYKDSTEAGLTEVSSVSGLNGQQICIFQDSNGKKYWAKIDKLEEALKTYLSVEVTKASEGDYYKNDTKDYIAVSAVQSTKQDKYSDSSGLDTTDISEVTKKYTDLKNEQTSAYIAGKNASISDGGTAYVSDVDLTAINAIKSELGSINPTFKAKTESSSQYEYWVKITTKDSATTKDIDVVGKISVGTSKSSAEKDGQVSVDFTLTNSNPGNNSFDDADSDVYIEPGERAVVSFADDASDEFEVEFGDDARFVFNARGQGKLNLAYNTKYNKDFAYDYDDANIDFINFEGEPVTNRTGTLYIYADKDSYIYEVTSKGAKKINGAYYDKDEEAWVIRTRSLTSYAISDKKLKTVDQMNTSSSTSSGTSGSTSTGGSTSGKPNPNTGR